MWQEAEESDSTGDSLRQTFVERVQALIDRAGSLPIKGKSAGERLRIFLAAFITFLFLFALGFIVSGYVHVLEGRAVNWSVVTLLMVLLCIALVVFDIHLFRNKDNYLG